MRNSMYDFLSMSQRTRQEWLDNQAAQRREKEQLESYYFWVVVMFCVVPVLAGIAIVRALFS